MTTMLAALLLSSGAAQAQDIEGPYEVQCIQDDIEVGIQMGHPMNPMSGKVWIDSFLLQTDCLGGVSDAQLDALYDRVLRGCNTHSTIDEVCLQVAADTVEITERQGTVGPIDQLVVSDITEDPKGDERFLLGIDFADKVDTEVRPALLEEDGTFVTNRSFTRRAPVAFSEMSCSSARVSGAYGELAAAQNQARIEYVDTTRVRCLTTADVDRVYDRWVRFDIRSTSRARASN